MMGHRQIEQAAALWVLAWEAYSAAHLLRSVNRFVDLQKIGRDLAPFYSSIGRPRSVLNWWSGCSSSVTASASDRNGACAMRFTSTWPTGGFSGSVWMGWCPIIRHSRRTGMAGGYPCTTKAEALAVGWSNARRYYGVDPETPDSNSPRRDHLARRSFRSGVVVKVWFGEKRTRQHPKAHHIQTSKCTSLDPLVDIERYGWSDRGFREE